MLCVQYSTPVYPHYWRKAMTLPSDELVTASDVTMANRSVRSVRLMVLCVRFRSTWPFFRRSCNGIKCLKFAEGNAWT